MSLKIQPIKPPYIHIPEGYKFTMKLSMKKLKSSFIKDDCKCNVYF